tara:strand:- start:1260 stop:2171 length:912 start_codon:yes stop_codon:yes gene_type:complete
MMSIWACRVVLALFFVCGGLASIHEDPCQFCSRQFSSTLVRGDERFFASLKEGFVPQFPFDFAEPLLSCELESRDGYGDGPKWVCGLELLPSQCLVLSFGSSCEFGFERSVRKYPKGKTCEMHIYDPYSGKECSLSGAKSVNATFHFVGLGRTSRVVKKNDLSAIQFQNLPDILRELRLEGRTIDVLKMDIEGAEYESFAPIFELMREGKLKVGQFLIEMHALSDSVNASVLHHFFRSMWSTGNYLFHKERNGWGCGGTTCVEFSFVSAEYLARVYHSSHCPQCHLKDLLDHTNSHHRRSLEK